MMDFLPNNPNNKVDNDNKTTSKKQQGASSKINGNINSNAISNANDAGSVATVAAAAAAAADAAAATAVATAADVVSITNSIAFRNSGLDVSDRMLMGGIMDAYPSWDLMSGGGLQNFMPPARNSPPHSDFFLNNINGYENQGNFVTPPPSGPILAPALPPILSPSSEPFICAGPIGSGLRNSSRSHESLSNSNMDSHRYRNFVPNNSNQSFAGLPLPIGTSGPGRHIDQAPESVQNDTHMCEVHNEILRFVCDFCRKLICQCCTLHEHKDHMYVSIHNFIATSKEKLELTVENSMVGTKCIKASIDKALAFIRLVERNCSELSENIRKAFRQFIIAIEDREHFLLDYVEKLRQRRLAVLNDQMAGLKSALTGLSETTEMLIKLRENAANMDEIEIAMELTNGERQMEQFAGIYKDLQPIQEVFTFAPPDYGLLQDIRNQGGIVLVDDQNLPNIDMGVALGTMLSNGSTPLGMMPNNVRRPLLRDNTYRIPSPIMPSGSGGACGMTAAAIDWELNGLRHSPRLHFGPSRLTQCIPGSLEIVRARNSNALTMSFGTEGHDDGQVSRPWGLCVNKKGHILVSDRRNNRVQVFNMDGSLRFKFGRKGVGNGEFDLPAGICVDIDNRIIVVDKDNHRVQIFTASGVFLLKFGSYGKEYGQFQYPWDVAVNSRRQIVVTDSRNHRIQQFDSEGRFIRQIVFDNHGHSKTIASPRGVCYTPTGNIIVSDFDNHCLYLIDPDINEILSVKGHEGAGYHEFNRPSGLCCDDEGRIIVADSKNQRILVFNQNLDFLWNIEIRPKVNTLMPSSIEDKDRTCDVAVMPDGRVAFLIELAPDSKEGCSPYKRFVNIF